MKNTILLALGLLVLLACSTKENDCATVSPPDSILSLSIIDADGNSLIGEDNVYKPAEMTLTRQEQNIPLMFEEITGQMIMRFDFYTMESEENYFLKLNEEEVEVVNLKIISYNSECFKGLRGVEEFHLNGEEISRNADYIYLIQK